MKAGMTLEDVAKEVRRQAAAKEDYLADTRHLTLASNGSSALTVAGPEPLTLGVRDFAHGQIADRLGIPKAYYDRMRGQAPDLLDTNVNRWFTDSPEERMLRTIDGDVRAFVSNRYRRLDNDDLMEALLPVLADMPDVRFESCALTETRLYIKAVLPSFEAEVVGQPVQYGLLIRNSEVGSGSLVIAPFTYVLVCRNGMTHEQFGSRRYHVGRQVESEEGTHSIYRDETVAADDKAFWMKAQDAVRAAATDTIFNQIVNRYREAAGHPIEAPAPEAVSRLSKRYGLTEGEGGSVLNYLIEGGQLSIWGLANAVTRASQDADSYDRASELERVGGQIVEAEEREWAALVTA